MLYERDFIRRMIQQLAQFVGRVLRLKQEEKYDEALQVLEEAYLLVLGPDRQWLKGLDARSVATILGDAEQVKAYARIHREEGELAALKCDAERAEVNYDRARDLYMEALNMKGPDDEIAEALHFLAGQLSEISIGTRKSGP